MDRADLELVVAIGRTGSLPAASRALHTAQPPLSRRLQAIERAVGTELFTRGRHGATPTVAGRTLIDRAELALAAITRAEQDTADVAGGGGRRARRAASHRRPPDARRRAAARVARRLPGVASGRPHRPRVVRRLGRFARRRP